MRKENEKSIKKKQIEEHIINSIDDKYIKQAADYKAKNNKYKKFIKKYEKKINEMKNNQKLVDEFLEDYNKITEK